jgi:hypothetical protein
MSPTSIIDSAKQKDKQQPSVLTFVQLLIHGWSKRLIFLAIPMNTALYGTESWTLNVELRRQISSFYHTTIRRIIGINMHHVAEYQIKNEHIRNYFSVPIQLTSYKNANSICLANLPAWIQLASLASFSPPGLATLDALVDSTTHYETHTSRHFSIFSQIFQTMAPSIHGCPLRRTVNSGKHSGLNG